jgi:hypothetical protein
MQHKPWFDKGCSELLDKRKQAKLQWLQNVSQMHGGNTDNTRQNGGNTDNARQNGGNTDNARRQDGGQLGRKRNIWKAKLMSLKETVNLKMVTKLGLTWKKIGRPNGDVHANSHNIFNRWKNYSHQLSKVHGVNDVRLTEIHRAEPLVPEPRYFEVVTAIEELKIYNIKFWHN